MKHYRSSIPATAWERVVSRYESNGAKHKVEYVFDRKIVGMRSFDEGGQIELEVPLKDGLRHGTIYSFDPDSSRKTMVTFSEPYRNGLAHGIARQWSQQDGKLIGAYSMDHGTGLDLWRNWSYDKKQYYLSEARHLKDGNWHGFEWWINEDQKTISVESHFGENLQHGIRREWNHRRKLRRGFPQYFVKNKKVSKRQYLRACAADPSLPRFRMSDNRPRREFPMDVLAAIGKP